MIRGNFPVATLIPLRTLPLQQGEDHDNEAEGVRRKNPVRTQKGTLLYDLEHMLGAGQDSHRLW